MYGRKYDAKASVCALAISDGALDFIYDEPSASFAAGSERASTPLEMDDSVKAIEQCCLEWTGGRVKPFWLDINEPKLGKSTCSPDVLRRMNGYCRARDKLLTVSTFGLLTKPLSQRLFRTRISEAPPFPFGDNDSHDLSTRH